MDKRPICLIIRDGWGKGNNEKSNAILNAKTPHTDLYEKKCPTTTIKASGLSVGLPAGYQGNSEVGHLNIGAGRVVYQNLTRIDKSIKDGDFFDNKTILKTIEHAKKNNKTLHLIGLIQEEGVHSVTRHSIAILEMCKKAEFKNVVVHALTDGRDTPPKSAIEHLTFLQNAIDRIEIGAIASVIGRYYAMDRDNRWDRTELAYRAIIDGQGKKVKSWKEAVDDAYNLDETDEFIKPRLINYDGAKEGDSIIFFNFRYDRARQLTKAIVEPKFNNFEQSIKNFHFVTMTHYYDDGNFEEAYPEMTNINILGELLSEMGLKQLRCAETEKYAHVTFFFNSLRNDPFKNEDRLLTNSPKIATYDLKPEMSPF